MINWDGNYEADTSMKSDEMTKVWRREFYEADAKYNRAVASINMHPEKYVMSFLLHPDLQYNCELAKAKFQIGMELKKLLNSKPAQPQEKPLETGGQPTVESVQEVVKKLKGQ